jgi:UDPglucose 6-dehydrogenase
MKKKVGIVGYGYVGKAMHGFFYDHYETFIYDEPLKIGAREQINECDLAVVCVPTPMRKDGSCDISIVRDVVNWLATPNILLKSTVPPGTTDFLQQRYGKRIVFSPEYCGESSYWSPYKFHTDVRETPFFIFGGASEATSAMVDFFLPVTGPVKTYRQTTAKAAELAKYMENCFYATKIMFCYEMAEVAKAMAVDFNDVRELWLLDPRINPMHTAVFKENARPFSGKCLPKDLSALIESSIEWGYTPEFLKAVRDSNSRLAEIRGKDDL